MKYDNFAYISDGAYCLDCACSDKTNYAYEVVLMEYGYPDGYTCASCGEVVTKRAE